MNSLEFIKRHVTEWPSDGHKVVVLHEDGVVSFPHFSIGQGSRIVDLSEHFAPDYHDGKVWTREEFEAFGLPQPTIVDWDNAPSWATCYGVAGGDKHEIWYDHQNYKFLNPPYNTQTFGGLGCFRQEHVTHIMDRPTPNEPSVDATVEERGDRYGTFKDGADIMQELKSVMRSTPNWSRLTPSQREALEMIQHKVGRILNGDPNYTDSWHDIKGYAHLIEEELNGNAK